MTAVSETRGRATSGIPRFAGNIGFGLMTLLALVVGLWAYAGIWPAAAVFGLFGLAFGFVLQRSRFCFASAFRDLWLLQDGRMMRAVLLGMAIATLGFALVEYNLVPNLATGQFPVGSALSPLGPHLMIAGVIFGIGMVIAGGCVSGNLYRMGEGYVASWVAAAGMLVGMVLLLHTFNWWWELSMQGAIHLWLPQWVGWGGAVALTLLGLLAAYLAVVWVESAGPPRFSPPARASAESGFRSEVTRRWKTVFQHGWPAVAGAAALALLNILFFMYQRPVGVTGEMQRWALGLARGIGFPPPPLPGGWEDLGACVLVPATGLLTPTLFLNVSLVLGSFVAATLSGEFKIRIPAKRSRFAQSFAGGLLMGYGAALAAGCTLGAFFSAVPALGLNGWVFALGLLGGSYLGVRLLRLLP